MITKRFWIIAVLALVLFFTGNNRVFAGVGFQKLSAYDLTIGIWYPTQSSERANRLGPFDVELAFDSAPVSEGLFQIVLLSHGNSGRMRNHHLTAKALASSGFIVIAPLHGADHLIGGSDTYNAIHWRTLELSHAIEAILQLDSFRRIIDLTQIHAIGYSLGAVTVLHAAGIGIDGTLVEAHCIENQDPAFCDSPSWFLRQKIKYYRGVTTPNLERDIPKRYFSFPFVNGSIAVIAPVGQGLVFDKNTFRGDKVFIVGFHDDRVTVPRFHAENIVRIIPENYIAHFSLRDGHHSAFIAPFAKRVTDEAYIEVAQDPVGFDRLDFLTGLNEELVAFFLQHSRNKGKSE